MSNKYILIDTSAWLFVLKKDFIPEIKDRIDFLLKDNLVVTTGIIRLELLGGTRTESEYQRLRNRLLVLGSIKSDESLWDMASDLAFKLRRKGVTVPYTDILIAACALSSECILLHADNHFDIMAPHCNLNTESYVNIVRSLP